MNWTEKVSLINNQARECRVGTYFSLLAHACDYMSLLDLEKKIKEGNLEAVREIVSILTPQLDVYKAAIKTAKKYEKAGGKVCISIVRYTGSLPLKFSDEGVLRVYSLEWPFCPFEEQSKFFLWASRLLRDAEVRCLKHPMYKGV